MENLNEGKNLVFSGAIFFCSSNGLTLKWCLVSHKFLKLIVVDNNRYWVPFARVSDVFKTYCVIDVPVLRPIYGNSIYDVEVSTFMDKPVSFYYSDCIAI